MAAARLIRFKRAGSFWFCRRCDNQIMTSTFLTLVITASLSVMALAQHQASPSVPTVAQPPSMHGYGDVDTTCLQWEDGCRACSRGTDGAPLCSNIGIACQPKNVHCTTRRPEERTTPK
jgi:hypothetical protein